MLADFGFNFHLVTIALAVRQLSRTSHCSSVLDISLAFLSLFPTIYAFALFLKVSFVGGFLRLNDALAYANRPDVDSYVFSNSDSGERCPGHLDTSECRTLSRASSRHDVSHESALSPRAPSAQCAGYEHNHPGGPLLPNPHVVPRSPYARLSRLPPTNACPSTVLASKTGAALPQDPRLGPSLFADLELSSLGRHLARHYGMFAWRIHPLIRAHNAFVGLDASFRRLDMFMHSPRAGMLYHELVIFIDHTAAPQELSGGGKRRAMWQMYAARTRECALSDPSHACFQPVDGGGCDGAEEWQNCLQWDALMARVLNTGYMRRANGEAVVQRWDRDAWEYWTRVEGISQAKADRVAKAVLAYGSEGFPTEGEFRGMASSGSKVCSGNQTHTRPTLDRQDEFGCAINSSSSPPNCDCGWGEDMGDRGAQVDSALYEFDFEEEIRAQDRNGGRGLELRRAGELGLGSDFGSLDSILSDATLPPASLTPSSSEASLSDATSERILYPRHMRCSTPISRQRDSQRRSGLVRPSSTRIYPAAGGGSPTFAISSSSERILANFSMSSLTPSATTSVGLNTQDGRRSSSPSLRTGSSFTSAPAEVTRPYQPSLLDLGLGLGTRGEDERLRTRELTSSSSYPSPPPSPSPLHTQDSHSQVPEACTHNFKPQEVQVMSESEYKYLPSPSPWPFSVPDARDNSRIPPNNATCTAGGFAALTEELATGPPGLRTDSGSLPLAGTTQSLLSLKKMRVTLNLRFNNLSSYGPLPRSASQGPSTPKMRTVSGIGNEALDRGDGDCELIASRSDLSKKTLREDGKMMRQREGRRIRIEVTEARDTECSAVSNMACKH